MRKEARDQFKGYPSFLLNYALDLEKILSPWFQSDRKASTIDYACTILHEGKKWCLWLRSDRKFHASHTCGQSPHGPPLPSTLEDIVLLTVGILVKHPDLVCYNFSLPIHVKSGVIPLRIEWVEG